MLTVMSVVVLICAPLATSFAGEMAGDPGLFGRWNLIPDKSSEISLYATLFLDVHLDGDDLVLIQQWGGPRRNYIDTLRLKVDGRENKIPVTHRVFPSNVFMGLSLPVDDFRLIKANWDDGGTTLRLEEQYQIRASQGFSPVTALHTISLAPNRETISYTIHRSTRTVGPEIKYMLKRDGLKEAYYMQLEDGWTIGGKLPEQVLLITLQGVANMQDPILYFIYPPNWPFTYTQAVFDFYKNERNYTFTELRTVEMALSRLKDRVSGYVVWDKEERTSLIVAFTVCGLEKTVAVSEELIPLVEKLGLPMVEDFRGKFTGMNDAEIYQWAYDRYWDRCSRDFIIWMGGEHGETMKPGVADWGIYNRAFFNDLSARPEDTEEYELANKMLSQQNPASMVMGWHSYKKDKERDHVKLCSSYGLRVEGLHTIPNLSFSSQVKATPGFQFKNNHNIKPGKTYKPKKKVYITCVQTDGLGIGAWLKPGRGEIPYAWEVIMNYYWMAPAMQEFFYSMATPNDYFIGCLSGPGYIYPKAVPPKKLPLLIEKARDLMEKLDLRVFEIMDYSEGATVEGNTELTREVVDAYYSGMPDAIGFLNGYAPAFTFTNRDGRPLISYDYYLSPTRSEQEAVVDLHELAAINKKRPYFLLVHVRESSDVKRVKEILDKLGNEFEVVPLDIFLKMAGEKPTFKERFLQR